MAAAVLLLSSGSGFLFYFDEWRFIQFADDVSFQGLMEPYNQHWFLTLKLVWLGLMETVGLRSYFPYHLVVVLLHISIATGLYVYARRKSHPLVALAVGVLFLFLGAGHTNVYWAGSLGFVLATAFGVWALVVMLREPEPRRPWVAAVLLLLSVTSSGAGLFFLAAAAVVIAIRDLRRWWWVAAPAAVSFGAWYLTFGRSDSMPLPSPAVFFEFFREGVANSILWVSGVEALGQLAHLREELRLLVCFILVGTVVVVLLRRSKPNAGLVGGAVGFMSLWIIIGIARSAMQPQTFSSPRFVYEAGALLLIAFIAWIGQRELGSVRRPRVLLVAIGLVAVLAVSWNTLNLVIRGSDWYERGQEHRAVIAVTLDHGGDAFPAKQGWYYGSVGTHLIPRTPQAPIWVPGRDGLESLFGRYGSPLDDPLAFRGTDIPQSLYDEKLALAVRGGIDPDAEPLPAE